MSERNAKELQGQIDFPKLIADLASKDLKIHTKAHLTLLTAGEKAVADLVKALANEDKSLRWEVAKTLAEMRNPALAPVFARELENKDPDIRWLSAEGLLALGTDGLPALIQALIDKPKAVSLLQGGHHVLQDLYLRRRHEGESEYYTFNTVDEDLRQQLKPVIVALEAPEPSHSLPAAAKAALNYIQHGHGSSQK